MDRRRATLRGRFEARPCWAGLGLLIAVLWAGPAWSQDEVRNFRMPVLMVETGGHHARVRSLVWQDDLTLLSGGEDKVVKVWDFHGDPRLARSIRPMIWRGPAGTIYAMAVSPQPDAPNQSFLAVAGYGIEARRGDITVFRIPGLERTPTGEVVTRMMPPPDGQPQAMGHTDVVTCLAFAPNGRALASGSADNTIILWNVPGFQPRAVLRGHTRPVRSIAFSPNSTRLASGGEDGSLRLWDVAGAAEVAARPGNANQPNPINTVAFSPDGASIVVGLERPGRLYLFQAANLAAPAVRLPTQDTQGPVECVAYHPDAQRPRLAVSIKSDASEVPDSMRMSCDVELRDMPAGNVVQPPWRVPGLVHALAFSRDGLRLAFAGGHSQSIQIADLAAAGQLPREIKGAGSTPFDVRFAADSKVIGFTRDAFDPANPPASYQGFDLEQRAARTVARNELTNGPILQFEGWNLTRSTDPLQLAAVNANNAPARFFAIDRLRERQAWSWTFIPGAALAGHPRATIAIGTESGVAIFDFENGTRTRVYAGHSSPVVSLAPSLDGRWLASASLDQTVLLYPLAGCDIRAPLGVTFRPRADGAPYVVESSDKGSFAAAMGLLPTDVLLDVGIAGGTDGIKHYRTPAEMDEFFRLLPSREPYLYEIGIKVRRTMLVPLIGPITFEPVMPTTRRNNAALALFLGTDREWVLWTPQGYYDTSIEGDARFLGWHINPPFQTFRPTDFMPIGTFAEAMNRRDLLDRLWRFGSLDPPQVVPPVAVAPAPPPAEVRPPAVVAAEDQPPKIVFAPIQGGIQLPAPGVLWVVDRPNVPVALKISAAGKSAIRSRRIILDEQPILQNVAFAPTAERDEQVPLNGLVPNRQVRLAVEATNAAGGQRTETIDIVYLPPRPAVPPPAVPPPVLPPPAPPRLHIVAIGCDKFAGLPALPYAGRDAKALAEWLANHLTSADGTHAAPEQPALLEGLKASARSLTEACDHLQALLRNKQIHKHDIVAIVIASHVLAAPEGLVIAGSDTLGGNPPRPAFAAQDLCEIAGQLTDYGCRVAVFLDGVHKLPEPLRSEIKPLVRDLQRKRGAITFIASTEGPSGADATREHGFFALGVTRVLDGADLAGVRKDRSGAYTLDQFRTSLKNEILNLSSRRQQASCYIPIRVPERTPFVSPRK